MGFCVRDLIMQGSQDPDATAIESPGYNPLTYRALREQVITTVRSLNARGLRPNDRVAVVMPSGPHAAAVVVAIMAGFALIPLNPELRAPEYSRYFSMLDIRAVLVQKGATPEVELAARKTAVPVLEVTCSPETAGLFSVSSDPGEEEALFSSPSDIATLLQTSGTTGKPKIVAVTQKSLFGTMYRLTARFGITASDRHLHTVPLDTNFGITSPIFYALLRGGCVIRPHEFIAVDFLSLLKTFRPTFYFTLPAHFSAVARELRKLPPEELAGHSLRLLITAASVLDPAVKKDLGTLLGIPVIEIYGMSEAMVISVNQPFHEGSVGLAAVELEVWDDENHPLPAGQTGEFVVRGEGVFDGYLHSPEENAAVFTNGWFRTGDMGYRDEEGYLFITGRKKELINKGGRKIAPAEIDAVILSHPGVRETMTFAIRDPLLGEDIGAMVVPSDGMLTEKDLRRFLLDRLLPSKIPQRIFFVDTIPRNQAGKPLRAEGTKRYSR